MLVIRLHNQFMLKAELNFIFINQSLRLKAQYVLSWNVKDLSLTTKTFCTLLIHSLPRDQIRNQRECYQSSVLWWSHLWIDGRLSVTKSGRAKRWLTILYVLANMLLFDHKRAHIHTHFVRTLITQAQAQIPPPPFTHTYRHTQTSYFWSNFVFVIELISHILISN